MKRRVVGLIRSRPLGAAVGFAVLVTILDSAPTTRHRDAGDLTFTACERLPLGPFAVAALALVVLLVRPARTTRIDDSDFDEIFVEHDAAALPGHGHRTRVRDDARRSRGRTGSAVEVKRALFRQAGAAGRVTAARAC